MKAKKAEISIEEKIRNRRYASRPIARKQWNCSDCADEILPGDTYEYSWTQDMSECLRLCLKCVAKS